MISRRSFFKNITTAIGAVSVAPHVPHIEGKPTSLPQTAKLWYRLEKSPAMFDPDGILSGRAYGVAYCREDALEPYLNDGWQVIGQPLYMRCSFL
jgi:hypothetical protein